MIIPLDPRLTIILQMFCFLRHARIRATFFQSTLPRFIAFNAFLPGYVRSTLGITSTYNIVEHKKGQHTLTRQIQSTNEILKCDIWRKIDLP